LTVREGVVKAYTEIGLAESAMMQFRRVPAKRLLRPLRHYATLTPHIKPGDSLHGFTVREVEFRNKQQVLTLRSRKFQNLNCKLLGWCMIRQVQSISILHAKTRTMFSALDLALHPWTALALLISSYD
jgi:hypothetical protein